MAKTKRKGSRQTQRPQPAKQETASPTTSRNEPGQNVKQAAFIEPPASSLSRLKPRQSILLTLALWSLIMLGIGCRFVGLFTWDEGAHLHPDERFLTMVVPQLMWPHSLPEYFHTQIAPLNPINYENARFFVYGQLPLFIAKIAAIPFKADDYEGILRVGRALSALFDTGTVLLIFFMGRRLGGKWLGLLAAALLALVPLHIQHAHFFVVDTFTAFFLTASFLFILRWYNVLLEQGPGIEDATPRKTSRDWRPALIAGICWGAAMACKLSAALFMALVVPALITAALAGGRNHPGVKMGRRVARAGLIIFATAFITFRIGHPMAFNGTPTPLTLWGFLDVRLPIEETELNSSTFLQSLAKSNVLAPYPTPQFWSATRRQERITNGEDEVPYNWQWIGRRNYVWPLRNLLLWAVGWPLMLAGIAGIGMIFIRCFRRYTVPYGLLMATWWVVFMFLYHARVFSKFSRYYLIGTPLLALCAAYLLIEVWRYAQQQDAPEASVSKTPLWRWAATALNVGVLGLTALWAFACTSIYTRPHTRMEASRWIRQHIPPGTPVIIETGWDDPLPIGDVAGLQQLNLDLYDHDNDIKRQKMLDMLDQAQWIFISSQRVWSSVPRVPQRWPMTVEYYRALFDGRLGFAPVQEFTSYPQLNILGLHLQFPDDNVEEALSVYDHPRVVLFQKAPTWSRQQAEQILNPAILNDVKIEPMSQIRDSGWRPDEKSLPWPPSSTPNSTLPQ